MKAAIGKVFPPRIRSAASTQSVKVGKKVDPRPKRTRSAALGKGFPKRTRSAGVNDVKP